MISWQLACGTVLSRRAASTSCCRTCLGWLATLRVRMDLEAKGEPGLVWVAGEVRAARQRPEAFDAAFAEATVFVQRLWERVGVMTADLPDRGRWVLAFSTLPRLARYASGVPWLSTSGSDLLDQLPPGVGVLLDVEDAHGLPLLPHGDARPRFSNEAASG